MTDLRRPDFVIIGAPRCGTTGLARRLAAHPGCQMTRPKEPFWFGNDLAPLREREGITTVAAYRALYPDATSRGRLGTLAAGEASTLYLSSQTAVAQLLTFAPEVRVIVLTRDPVDFLASWHQHLRGQLWETCASLEEAWTVHGGVNGSGPHHGCPLPRALDFVDMASFGKQLARTVDIAGPDRVLHLSFTELIDEADNGYARVSRFIGLDVDAAPEAPTTKVNERREPHAAVVSQGIRRLARTVAPVAEHLPSGLADGLRRVRDAGLGRAVAASPVPEATAAVILEALAEDQQLLLRTTNVLDEQAGVSDGPA